MYSYGAIILFTKRQSLESKYRYIDRRVDEYCHIYVIYIVHRNGGGSVTPHCFVYG